jgi:rRNA-processing protein EBP2
MPPGQRSDDDDNSLREDTNEDWALEAAALGVLRGRKVSEYVYDAGGLKQALAELEASAGTASTAEQSQFPERFRITLPRALQSFGKADVDRDQERETYFQAMATIGAWYGYEWCSQHGIPTERPEDYFADMIKSDEHMTRVRKTLLQERQRLHEIQRLRSEALTKLEAKRRHREAAVRHQESKRTGLAQIEQWKREQGLNRTPIGNPAKRGEGFQNQRSSSASMKGTWQRHQQPKRKSKKRPGKQKRAAQRQAHQVR